MCADPRPNLAVMASQAIQVTHPHSLHRPLHHLCNSQRELRHHVPINAPQPFIFVERAGTPREGLVIENLLVQIQTNRCSPAEALILQRLPEQPGIAECRVEMDHALRVPHDDAVVVPP